MIPGRGALRLLAIWAAAAAGPALDARLLVPWIVLGCALAAVLARACFDLARLPLPAATRTVDANLALNVKRPVRVAIVNPGGTELNLELFDEHPSDCDMLGLPAFVRIPAGGIAEARYFVRPRVRGDRRFGGTQILVRSKWDLWRRRLTVGGPSDVRVLPDFAAVSQYAILASADRTGQMGVRLKRRRGEGLELHQLREYREGDTSRQIDWKATARRQQIISKEYQAEQNQHVIVLLDCGRRMRAVDDGVAHFDHALNAVLLLSHVALRQGDAVGLLTFGGAPRWLPPVRGRTAGRAILRAVYDLETVPEVPDYQEAARAVLGRLRRRALVVFVTNLRDEDADELIPVLELLRRRHLVLLASLRETALEMLLERPVTDLESALRLAAAHRHLDARRRVHEAFRRRKVPTLDVTPRDLPVRLVNRYLEVKASRAL